MRPVVLLFLSLAVVVACEPAPRDGETAVEPATAATVEVPTAGAEPTVPVEVTVPSAPEPEPERPSRAEAPLSEPVLLAEHTGGSPWSRFSEDGGVLFHSVQRLGLGTEVHAHDLETGESKLVSEGMVVVLPNGSVSVSMLLSPS